MRNSFATDSIYPVKDDDTLVDSHGKYEVGVEPLTVAVHGKVGKHETVHGRRPVRLAARKSEQNREKHIEREKKSETETHRDTQRHTETYRDR